MLLLTKNIHNVYIMSLHDKLYQVKKKIERLRITYN